MDIDTFIKAELSEFLFQDPENHLTEHTLDDLTRVVSILSQKIDSLKQLIDEFTDTNLTDTKDKDQLRIIAQVRTDAYAIIFKKGTL